MLHGNGEIYIYFSQSLSDYINKKGKGNALLKGKCAAFVAARPALMIEIDFHLPSR